MTATKASATAPGVAPDVGTGVGSGVGTGRSRWWGGPSPSAGEWAGLAGVLVLVALLAALRWTGVMPFGSDNDEYRMLADALYETGRPLIGGVEGTKYPVGWSLLIGALDRLGADATVAPMLLNVLLVAGTAVLVWLTGRRLGAVAGLAGATAVVASSALWGSVYVVMPDAALTFVVAAGLYLIVVADRARDVWWLVAVALAAALLKTVGVILAGALTVGAFARRPMRWWSWAPVTVALAVTALQSLWVSPYPEHTTGYGATFWLVDPTDASLGEIGPAGLPARIVDRLDLFLTDAAKAVVGPDVPSALGIALVLALLAAAVLAFRHWGWRLSVVSFVVVYAVALAAWPYRSDRFGLPFLPLAALGLAGLVGWVQRRSRRPLVAGVVAVALLAPHLWFRVDRIALEARMEEEQFAPLAADTAELVDWLDANVPADEPIVSFDYREVAYRAGRDVLPLGYTSDADVLLAASAGRGGRWLVVLRGLYGQREARVNALLQAHSDRFELVHSTGRADVYRILPMESAT